MEFSKLFLYIPGVIIFLVGSGQIRQRPGLFGGKGTVRATVVRCDHVVKKDRKDRKFEKTGSVGRIEKKGGTAWEERWSRGCCRCSVFCF